MCLASSSSSSGATRRPPAASKKGKKHQPTPSKKKPPTKILSSSEESEGSFQPDDDSDSDPHEVDPGYLDIEADLDEMSDYANSNKEELNPTENIKWRDFYLAQDKTKNPCNNFVSAFFRCLLHVEGGSHSDGASPHSCEAGP